MEQQSSASEEESSSSSSSSSSLTLFLRVNEEVKVEEENLSKNKATEKVHRANTIVNPQGVQDKISAIQINEFVTRCRHFLEAKGFTLESKTVSRLYQIMKDRHMEISSVQNPIQRNLLITKLFNDFLKESLNTSLTNKLNDPNKAPNSNGKTLAQSAKPSLLTRENKSPERMVLEEERKHIEPARQIGAAIHEPYPGAQKVKNTAGLDQERNKMESEDETDIETKTSPKDMFKTDKTTAAAVSAGDSKKIGKKLEKLEDILDNYLVKLDIKNDEVRQMCTGLLRMITPCIQVEFRNKPFEAVVASILLAACSHLQYPITIKEVVNIASDVKGKALTKIIHKCIFVVKGYLLKGEEFKIHQPEELVRKIAERISLHTLASYPKCEAVCKIIIESLRIKNLIMGRHSSTIAAYALLLSCFLNGIKITLKQIAEAANINKITLKNLYRDLFPMRGEFVQNRDEFNQVINQIPYCV